MAAFMFALLLASSGRGARAATVLERSSESTAPPTESTRLTWTALAIGYAALGAVATGAAYAWRDNFVGRSIAVTSAGFGGLTLGASAGYGLAALGCRAADCAMAEQVATGVGGVIGSLAGGLAGHLLTRHTGVSRPEVTAAGAVPALVLLVAGTVAAW